MNFDFGNGCFSCGVASLTPRLHLSSKRINGDADNGDGDDRFFLQVSVFCAEAVGSIQVYGQSSNGRLPPLH